MNSQFAPLEEPKPGAFGPDAIYPVTLEQWRNPPEGMHRRSSVKWIIYFRDGSQMKVVEDRLHMQIQGNAAVFAMSEFNGQLRDRLVIPLDRIDQIQEVITKYLDPEPNPIRTLT